MKYTIIEEALYLYNELDEMTQEIVIENHLNDEEVIWSKGQCFKEYAQEVIKDDFSHTLTLKGFYYSLGYSQGDGVSFEGVVNVKEFLKAFKNEFNFSQKVHEELLKHFEESETELRITHSGGRYYHKYMMDYELYSMYFYYHNELNKMDEGLKEAIKDVKNAIIRKAESTCDSLEKIGYEMFDTLTEDDVEEIESYYYYEDGEIYDKIEDVEER